MAPTGLDAPPRSRPATRAASTRSATSPSTATRVASTRSATSRSTATRAASTRSATSRPTATRPASARSSARPSARTEARRRPPTRVDARASTQRTRRRLVSLLVVMVLALVVVAGKLADLQLLRPGDYRELSAAQRVRDQVLSADRGTIFDRNGVELAVSVPSKTIFVDPALVADPASESAQLAEVLGLDADDIEDLMTADNRFGYVARQVPDDVAEAVVALDLPGVALIEEPKRFAPNGDLGRSIVGLTDIDGQPMERSGLEYQYRDLLIGTPGRLLLEQTPDGGTIPVGDHHYQPPVKGQDLVLTIDRSLQFEAERILAAQVEEAGAKGGIAVVSRPDTGELLAIANITRDPETDEVEVDGNMAALTTVYEPGSAMKLVSASAAIEDGLVEPDTALVVPDTMTLGGAQFSEHDYHGTVSWPVAKIISESSNIGTIKLAQMLGKDRVYEYLQAFGFGERTAVDFPNEQAGSVMAPEDWWGSSMGTIPIGQGVSVTPVQMLLAYNAIATGGTYVPPRLVLETVEPDGSRHPYVAGPERRIVSEDTADKMNLMLRGVVSQGTGKSAAVDGYTVAGKTGTSRKPQPGGGYTDATGVTRYQATFVGFVPAEAPALSIIVMIDEPSTAIFGGAVAAPAFSKIAEVALRRYDIAPPSGDRAARWLASIPEDATKPPVTRDIQTALPADADGRVRALAAGEPAPGSAAADGASTTAVAGGSGTAGGVSPAASAGTAVLDANGDPIITEQGPVTGFDANGNPIYGAG